jgi:DNA-directed RNA polymerase subunit RPC12/RpoP
VPKKKTKLPLSKTHPKLAKEAYGWDPTKITFGSNAKLEWQCKLGHNWIATPNKRSSGRNCPYCSGNKVLSGFNDLQTLNPKLAQSAFGWDPTLVSSMSGQKLKWVCQKNFDHVWENSPASRAANDSGCPFCSNQKLFKGENDLLSLYPNLAKEAYGWDPSSYIAGSNKKMTWKCSKNKKHIWKSTITNRKTGNDCPYCSRKKILTGESDIATLNPILAKEAHGWDPTKVGIGVSKRFKWVCSKNSKHIFVASPAGRSRGDGCPFCSGHKVFAGENDLKSLYPNLALQAYRWDPTTKTTGSNSNVQWICSLGHIWRSRIADRTDGQNCPVCGNKKLLSGFNDLATTFPDVAKEADGWDPSKVLSGTSSRRKWKCSNGHNWLASINSRTNSHKASNCPSCAESGFDPNKESYLYFLSHQEWLMYQIGITNSTKERIRKHQGKGWEVIEIRGPMDGHLTHQWETAILRMLKAKGADLANAKTAGKFDGYSEAWSKSTFPVKSIKELMRLTEEYEENN